MTVEILKVPVIQVEAADKTEKHHDYASSEWWLVYLTGALAAITFALALYTAKLWRTTHQLSKDARDASARQSAETIDAIAAAKQAANAATRSAVTAEKTAEHQLRAYVLVTSRHHFYDGGNGVFFAQVEIKNFGQTPAHNLSTICGFKTLRSGPPSDFDVPGDMEVVRRVLGPGDSQVLLVNSLFGKPAHGQVGCFFGEIKYVDVFEKERRTRFRLLVTDTYIDGEGIFKLTKEGNDAD